MKTDKDKIMEIFKTLISINTTTPPGNTYRSYVDAISPFFKEMDYDLEEVIVPDELIKTIPALLEGPRINLVANKKFNRKRILLFVGTWMLCLLLMKVLKNGDFLPLKPQ